MANRLALPPLYVILDAALLSSEATELLKLLMGAGARLFQYRNKTASSRELLHAAQALTLTARQENAILIVNDRPDIARLAGSNGVHVGQEDVRVEAARAMVGPQAMVGISTHNMEQFERAQGSEADYIAVGPVFETRSKANPDPLVGLDLIRRARQRTTKPIVAIGGITLERAASVMEAGADCVAVISDILTARNPVARVKHYLEVLPAAAGSAGN